MEILFKEPQPIPFHAIAAMIAIVLGGIQIARKKGGPIHKIIGRIWVVLILFISFSSFFIYQIKLWGNYSPIHCYILVIFCTGLFILRGMEI